MNLDKLLVIPSKSRYELEVASYGDEEEARKEYAPLVWENIRGGHYAQKENLRKVQHHFGIGQIIDRGDLTPEVIDQYDTFVFLGGDNHFTYCSQLLLKYLQENPDKEKSVLGTILDPKRSWGGQLYFTVDTFLESLSRLEHSDYRLEKWTTLETTVKFGEKDTKLHPAINEILAGETKRWLMSRNHVYLDGKEIFPDKSSGILIATGAGSGNGSWYDNVHTIAFGKSNVFSKEGSYASVILTEHKSNSKATLEKGQELVIFSSNDDNGIILPDAHEDHAIHFKMGAAAHIRVGDAKLPVVRMK